VHHFGKDELRAPAPHAFSRERDVRFQDIDAAGVIFYPYYFEFFHDTYVEFLAERGHSLADALRDKTWAAPLRHAEADYLRPLRFGQRIRVSLVRAHVEPTEVTIGYQIVEVASGQLSATGQTVHTFVDLASFSRKPIPEALKQVLESLNG
jgi:1,4-dihydroxy-2-naphthoyl-CoA hydrolase